MTAKKKKLINLLPEKEFEKTAIGRILHWALTTFRFTVIAVELVVIVGFLFRFFLDSQNLDLLEDLESKQNFIASFETTEKQLKQIQSKLAIYSSLIDEKNSFSSLMKEITTRLPADVELTAITKSSEGIEIKGSAFTEFPITQFLANLNNSKMVSQPYLSKLESATDSLAIQFTIKASSADQLATEISQNGK